MKLGILLSLLALGVPCLAPAQGSRASRHRPKRVVKLRVDLSRVKKNKRVVASQLKSTKKKVSAVRQDIHQVDYRLRNLEDAVAATTNRLHQSRTRQRTLSEQLTETQLKLKKSRSQVQARLRAIYLRGEPTLVSAFSGSQDMGDLASRKFLMQTIAQKDRQIFQEYRELTVEVSRKKRAQDNLVVVIHGLAAQQKGQQASLQDARAEKGRYLGELKEKVHDLEEVLRAFQRDEAAIEGQIRAYLASQRRPGSVQLPPFRGGFSRPIGGRVTSLFGMRFHPILRRVKLHTGVDFHGSYGASIRAAADGVVIGTSYLRGYGNTVILDHGSGISTVYAHCSSIKVRRGQAVRRGQPIAAVGSTGYSTGPHLHFEIRSNGRPVNPLGRI